MTESILAGNGIVLTHPVETFDVEGLVVGGQATTVNFPLTAEDGKFCGYSNRIPHTIWRLAHAASRFSESPQTIALSGFESRGKVVGINCMVK